METFQVLHAYYNRITLGFQIRTPNQSPARSNLNGDRVATDIRLQKGAAAKNRCLKSRSELRFRSGIAT